MSRDELKGEGDRYLIEELRAGSADAFRRLVDRFGGRLQAFANRRLHGTGLDPEDAVQETFLSLLRHLERLEGVRSLQAYLYTILRRRIADLVRGRGPAAAVSIDAVGEASGFELTSPTSTPSTHARQEEALRARRAVLADALESLVSRLKQERRFRDLKILELCFSAGVSNKEAAARAKTSEPTVSRTRSALIEELRRLVLRHPQADALQDLPAGDDVSSFVRELWAENLFSCLKRSTLGNYALGVLDADWSDYVRFHVEDAGCEVCASHLDDVNRGGAGMSESARQKIFASSVGFLR